MAGDVVKPAQRKGTVAVIKSMTGFAAATRDTEIGVFSADIRGVNNRGLDLKIRVPDGIDGLESLVRTKVSQHVTRGSVTVNIRLQSRQAQSASVQVNAAMLHDVLSAMAEIETQAMERNISLAPSNATDILGIKGVLDAAEPQVLDPADVKQMIETLLDDALDQFITSRRDEGRHLHGVLSDAINEIESLVQQAVAVLPDRQARIDGVFRESLARLTDANVDIDRERVAQEIGMILIKQDVKEELDRLATHIIAARELLSDTAPIGRRFDFLTQEFNREANTLCSKAQHMDLSRIGILLKTTIDQIREQVQNVE